MPFKINLKQIFIYAAYAAAAVFLNSAIKGVPLSLGLYFSFMLCGANIIAAPILYVLASAVNLNLVSSLISLFQGAFICLITFLYRRTGRKIKFEAAAYLVICLAPYVAFAPWLGAEDIFTSNEYILRSIAAGTILIFTLFCFRSVYALLFRLERCRLKEDEIVCICVTYAACGAGLYSLAGEAFYICVCAGVITAAVRLARSPAAIIAALVSAVPHAVMRLSFEPVTAMVLISVVALLFSGAGRVAAGLCTSLACAAYSYLSGCYNCPVPLIVVYAILLFFACFLPSVPNAEKFAAIKRRLTLEEVLPDTSVNRLRRRTGEKLYRISEVFREIECAFLTLDEEYDDGAARERMLSDLKEKCCKRCERAKRCERTNVYSGFKRLIDSGCVRGKVNLIDLPSEITLNCSSPSDVLAQLNLLLAEYRRFMTENENARMGRKLLADQARGVADVMKNCAVDLSRTANFSETQRALKKALAARGISCPELYVDGDGGHDVCAVVCGNANADAMAEVLRDTLKRKYILKDKLDYDGEKRCLIFGAPPRLDAAFGVAYAVKQGEKVSGDTHSVIKINERSFLIALSDGMGSGVYARKVSEAAISLIEAFYRAEMPEGTVLNTINKLLSFNRDERFTCIDVAAVNLETGRANFVKIGSPAGIILREGEIKILESSSLPLGILENLRPTVCTEQLKDGDMVVFMSDGITSAFPSSTEMYEFMQTLKPLNPQNLADKILACALDKSGHVAADDMTVVCTRIFDNA